MHKVTVDMPAFVEINGEKVPLKWNKQRGCWRTVPPPKPATAKRVLTGLEKRIADLEALRL